MAQNKFKAFLKDGLPFGGYVDKAFVIDAVGDPSLPDPKSWEELEDHLKSHDAPERTIKAAKHIWGLYVAHTRVQGASGA